MAIFARITLQTIIDENVRILTAEQVDRHIVRLNRAKDLSTEWGVVLLNTFSKIGKISHEVKELFEKSIYQFILQPLMF